MRTTALCLIFAAVLSSPAEAGRLRLPQANPSAQTELNSLRSEIDQKQISDAVARYDALRRLHGSDLVQTADNELISLNACLDDLTDAGQLTSEYQKRFDDPAHQMLQSVALDANSQPSDFYAVARRYWLSSAAAPALVAGADRAAATGDWPTADGLFQKARAIGWVPDPIHDHRIDALAAAQNSSAWACPIPFDATWYGRADASAVAKYYPCAAGGAVYVSNPDGVLAFKNNGDPLWAYPHASILDNSSGRDRPPLDEFQPTLGDPNQAATSTFTPAVLSTADISRVVIAVTPRPDAPGHILQAIRASDGKSLWRTDAPSDPALATLEFLPAPAICGRYVYALATAQDDSLSLIALDITTGRTLWKSALPALSIPAARFSEPAGITVDSDQLLLCPNLGCVFAMDRWDGTIRWMHPYPSLDQLPSSAADIGHWGLPPTPRFDNHPRVTGATAFFAPQDAQCAFALNSRTGQAIWSSTADYADMTLIGAVDQCAIFQGTKIISLQPGPNSTEEIHWTYTARPESITGPAALFGTTLFVPTTDKAAVPVSTVDGREMANPPALRPPNFRVILNSLAATDLISGQTRTTFGFPPPSGRRTDW